MIFWIYLCYGDFEGEKKHKKRGRIVLAFSSFSTTEVTDQKQIDFTF